MAVNLVASSLFLIGASIIYGVTGTLNMAELSARLSGASVANRHLIDAGAAMLAVAFLIKAGGVAAQLLAGAGLLARRRRPRRRSSPCSPRWASTRWCGSGA